MHKLISIDEATMDRFVTLKNEETGIEDECFDNSAMLSDEANFEFMKIGESYDCKISLLGDFSGVKRDPWVEITGNETEVVIGVKRHIKVKIKEDTYYLSKGELEGVDLKKTPYYCCTRKDLVQVDDVIDASLFWDAY